VTAGNNDFTQGNNGRYPAGPGYDMATGLGSPKADALAAALCADALRVNNPGTQLSTVGQPASLRITTSALSGSHLSFYASKLPPGLSLASSTGRIKGRPKRIGTWSVGVAALDQNLRLRAVFFNWRVVGAPVLSRLRLSGPRPTLSFTVTAGAKAPWLTAISIRLGAGASFPRRPHLRVTLVGTRRHGFKARLVRGRLRVVLSAPAWRIRVSVSAVRTSARITAAVRQNRTPSGLVAVMTTDSSGHAAWGRAATRG
jgi:hypothetical protein